MKKHLRHLLSPQGVLGLSLITLVGLSHFWVYHHDLRYDLTQQQEFTLSPQSQKLLARLPQEVKVTAFYRTRSPKRQAVANRLEAYREASRGQLSYELIDPELQPGLVERFKVSLDETLVIESGKGRKEILSADEAQLSTAIFTVTRKDKPKVYFVSGHQELPLDDSYSRSGLGLIKESLVLENYEVLNLALATHDYTVPKDARVVVLAGPERGLTPAERKALQSYLKQGGRLLVMLQARYESGLEAIFETYGMQVGNNIVVDPTHNLQRDYTVPLITQFQDHPITQSLQGTAVFFPLARSVQVNAPPSGSSATGLMSTSSASWGETNLSEQALIQKDSADLEGPMTLAVALEQGKTRLLVVGNATFISNRFAAVLGNRDFFLNAVAWLAGDQDRLDIHVHPEVNRQLVVSGAMLRWASIWAVLFPLLFALMALVIKRRRR